MSITHNHCRWFGQLFGGRLAHFLNLGRRSIHEVANILVLLSRQKLLPQGDTLPLLRELEEQSRMILAFRRTLKP